MKKIAIINQKGGVGKTSTAVNLSAALAALGCRVCLADMDPQAHVTLHVGVSPGRDDVSVYDVLTGPTSIAEVRKQVRENLWLIGSHINLAAAEVELAGEVGRELILRDKLAEDKEPFDYFIIDCPPSLGVLTLNALTTVDEVFIPLQPHFLALHGLSKLLETIGLVARRLNSRLKLSGVLLCLYESGTKLAAEIGDDVATFMKQQSRHAHTPWANAHLFQTHIRRNIRLAEAPSFGQTIFEYAPSSNGSADYMALPEEMLTVLAGETLVSSAPPAAAVR